MTDQEITSRLERLVRTERKITNEILRLVRLADERRVYLELGFSSLFDWMTKGLGYSESAAGRRIASARLTRAVPRIAEKIESGALNLTTLAKTQAAIRAQEKVTGRRLAPMEKADVLARVENKSAAETEKVLVDLFPESASCAVLERKTELSNDQVRLAITIDRKTLGDLERVKDLLSHTLPTGAGFSELIAHLAKEFRKRKDPLLKEDRTEGARKANPSAPEVFAPAASAPEASAPEASAPSSTAAAAKHRVSRALPAALRRAVLKRDGGRCTFEDPRTKRRCGSAYQVQIDHIFPKALGGEDALGNLRCLCRAHNAYAARLTLGESHANAWRR